MGSSNSKTFFKSLSDHITNLNHTFRGIKSNSIIDFIYINHCGLIVIVNKVAIPSELCVVKNYIKNTTSVDLNNVQFTYLLQSKLYLKILDISYLIKSTNMPINLSVVESIIKSTHIFDNIHIVLKPYIIKNINIRYDYCLDWCMEFLK